MGGLSADPGEKRGPRKDVERLHQPDADNTCSCRATLSAGKRQKQPDHFPGERRLRKSFTTGCTDIW